MFCALKASEKSNVPVLFMSNPGVGKSTTVEIFAQIRGYELVLLRGSSSTAEEILGYDTVDAEVAAADEKYAKHCLPSWYKRVSENTKNGKRTLLFLDELTTVNSFVQGALLNLIFNRAIDDNTKLPDDCLIVAAGNYSQNLSNDMTLLPPTMNRFAIVNLRLDLQQEVKNFLCKYRGGSTGQTKSLREQLREKFDALDKMEQTFKPSTFNKIGEMIEGMMATTLNAICSRKANKIDINETDLMNFYSQAAEDCENELYGFLTPRTINYARDMTIAVYQCFGREGIKSEVYKNIIKGLVGVSFLKREKNDTDAKSMFVYQDFIATVVSSIDSVDIVNNEDYSDVTDSVKEILMKDRNSLTADDIKKFSGLLDACLTNKSFRNMEAPISASDIDLFFKNSMPAVFKGIFRRDISKEVGNIELLSKLADDFNNLECSDLMESINFWNGTISAFKNNLMAYMGIGESPRKNASDNSFAFSENDKKKVNSRLSDKGAAGFKSIYVLLNTARKKAIQNKKKGAELLPELVK